MTTILGRYDVVGLLGSGGIGQVYAARDRSLGRLVAIKALRPEYSSDESFLERFHSEAASLARVTHQNIATLYDFQEDDRQLYMIMELVRGHTLEAVLARFRRLNLNQALSVASQIIVGLNFAHQAGVIHRDIKPSNIMITELGTLKIMDFGIARVRGSQRLTRAGSIIGTLAYVAPEQIKGAEGDEQSDLYSVACVLYEMLTGEPPFTAETEYDLIRAQVDTLPVSLASKLENVPPSLDAAITRALSKDPTKRFASMLEFGHACGADEAYIRSTEFVRQIFSSMGPVSLSAEDKTTTLALPIQRSLPGSKGAANSDASIRRSAQSSSVAIAKILNRPATPMVVLGSVITLLLLGTIYFAASSSDTSHEARMATPPETSVRPENVPPARDQPPSTLLIPAPGAVITQAAPPQPSTPPIPNAIANGPAGQEAMATSTTRGPLPDESPAYQGRVTDWPGPNLIVVPMSDTFGLKFLKLYGILGANSGQAQVAQDHTKLVNFLAAAGNKVICYARGESTFQCYANNQDIALWAVKAGLAKATPDAPKEYHEALSQVY